MNRIYPRNLSNFTHELTQHTPAALKKERKKKGRGVAYVWVMFCVAVPLLQRGRKEVEING